MENIRFSSKEHRAFYAEMLIKTRNDDSYHRALFYAMGICEETRRNIHTLFDFKNGGIDPDGLSAPWQTGCTRRLCRLAFNLWNGWTEEGREQYSAPYELFDCVLRRTFLKPSACVILNIAGTWSVSHLGIPINRANYQ